MMKNDLIGLACLVGVMAAPQAFAFDIMEKLGQVRDSVSTHLKQANGPLCKSPQHAVKIAQKHRDTVVEKAILETGCFRIVERASAVLSYTVTESGIEETASNDATGIATAIGMATGVPLLALVPKAFDRMRGTDGIRVELNLVQMAERKRGEKTKWVPIGRPIVAIGEDRSSMDRPSTHLATVRAATVLVQELKR